MEKKSKFPKLKDLPKKVQKVRIDIQEIYKKIPKIHMDIREIYKKIPRIHIDIDEIYRKYRLKFFIFAFIFFIVTTSVLYIQRAESYTKYERIRFQCAGSTLYANLYYPSKSLNFQNKHPLVIYCHGIGSRRDIDIRAPYELCKRGFYVATIDYQAHGESEGQIFDIDYDKDPPIPALAEVCTLFLDKLEETNTYKEEIKSDQIGLLGHSLGGLIVLINGALDDRFNATVTWAGLVQVDEDELDISKEEKDIYLKYHPKKIADETHPKNLLAIQHIDDEILPYKENGLYIHKLTNCKLITIREPLIGGAHNLYSNEVMIDTINWFEDGFFGSKFKNGPIELTYTLNFILIYLNFLALFLTSLSIMLYFSKYFSIKKTAVDMTETEYTFEKVPKQIKNKHRKHILRFIIIFIAIWGSCILIFGLLGLIIAPSVIILVYCFFRARLYFKKAKQVRPLFLKQTLRSQLQIKDISYSLFCVFVFLALYILYTATYPFAFFIPASILLFVLGIFIYPWYLAFELFYRKVIYPELFYVKSPIIKIAIISILAITTQISLMIMTLPYSLIQPVLATFIISLVVIIINSIIYEKTGKFSTVMLSSFLIVQLFFGATLLTVLSVNSVIKIMID